MIIKDKEFEIYLSKEEIAERISSLANEIENNLDGIKPTFISILNGSYIFTADLLRALDIECEVSFVKLASYKGTSSTGNVISIIGLEQSIHNKDVFIIEDIIDTGVTLANFIPDIQQRNPKSITIISLLSKPEARKVPIEANYVGFEIPNKFVVGYGLDYDGLGRNLSDLYILKEG